MLRSGWYTAVFVKSEESHRRKALLTAREQLVRMKRQIYGQVRGLLRPFGLRLPPSLAGALAGEAVEEVERVDAMREPMLRGRRGAWVAWVAL